MEAKFSNLLQRDESGVSGSFSEFLDYFMASLLSDDVRLVIGGTKRRYCQAMLL